MAQHIHVNVQDPGAGAGEADAVEALRNRIAAGVRATLDAHDLHDAEISLTLLDDEAIADLNARFLDHAGPTDVISFPLHDPGRPPVGDIYIGIRQVERQAGRFGTDAREELLRVAIHGTLHVLGYDHPGGEEREGSRMWGVQEEIVRRVQEVS